MHNQMSPHKPHFFGHLALFSDATLSVCVVFTHFRTSVGFTSDIPGWQRPLATAQSLDAELVESLMGDVT